MPWPGECSRQPGNTTRGSCCPRKRAFASGGLVTAFEEHKIRQDTVTHDPPGARFDIGPRHPRRAASRGSRARSLLQRENLAQKALALPRRQRSDVLEKLCQAHVLMVPESFLAVEGSRHLPRRLIQVVIEAGEPRVDGPCPTGHLSERIQVD